MMLLSLRIEVVMVLILISICLLLVVLSSTILTKRSIDSSSMTTSSSSSSVLASCLPPTSNINKREHEIYSLSYTVIWIAVFMVVIVTQMYEQFDAYSYLYLCVPLALPFLLQPILYPLPSERCLPLYLRYSFKANVWIAIFSFIGNYWYTHYFYSVLKARYTFPAHRLNDVPIALYFATHFYFMTYHTLSNMILRYIETRYLPDIPRTIFFWTAVVAFAYFTAFMETLTISSFPYYSFEDRYMAYTLGSAFYGIYFLVSFPMFYRLDEKIGAVYSTSDGKERQVQPHSVFQTCMEVLGSSMLVLTMLDVCRLMCGIDLRIGSVGYYLYEGAKTY